jgi:hypothetical protein
MREGLLGMFAIGPIELLTIVAVVGIIGYLVYRSLK